MLTLQGKTVYPGTALGRVAVFSRRDTAVQKRKSANSDAELERLRLASERSVQQLKDLYEEALEKVGEEDAVLFEIHRMMLEDEGYQGAIRNRIVREHMDAPYAVRETGDEFAQVFASMDDDYMKARAEDMKDISNRLIQNLIGCGENHLEEGEPAILLADDLTPSETVKLDKKRVLAIATVHGSAQSHTAILARMLSIPALIGVPMDLTELETGMTAVVSGKTGEIIFSPDEETCDRARQQIKKETERKRLLESFKGKETVTLGGRKISLCANISDAWGIEEVRRSDPDGIGLFRSEFLYLGRPDLPSEEEQFEAYCKVLKVMKGKKVIIRTLDLGADKQAEALPLPQEENPALGYRAIRVCLTQPELFRTQLRAILRAAVHGNLSVMYPMITSVREVERIQAIVESVRAELEAEGTPYRIPEQGLMIETPAAVMISDRLAKMADFFSIGTNDLTQYTLALDRQNGQLAEFYDPHHEAILRMIQMTVENAHKEGKWVGICGELGSDPSLIETFLDMEVDELSVAPTRILALRKLIRELP